MSVSSAVAAPVDALAQQEEHAQQELNELILQVQSKNQSLFTETLHRFQQSRSVDAARVRDLEQENATLRAQVDKLMQRVHHLPSHEPNTHTSHAATSSVSSTSTSAVSASQHASDLHALQARVAGLKEQLAGNERLLLQRQSDLTTRDETNAVLSARIAQLELELRESLAAHNLADDALARERAGTIALQTAAEQRVQTANAAAERSRVDAQATKERELRDLEESTRRRIETIQTQCEARWREAEAECERLRESVRRAERQALHEQQALLTLDAAGYDHSMMSPRESGSNERDQQSPDWLVARQKSNEERGGFTVATDSGVEERWARVYETLNKLDAELA